MVLASMIALDEDALICDLAETYHIYDYRSLPATQVGIYAAGLREDARIVMKMNKFKVPLDTMLLASIADSLHVNVWAKTKDAQTGKNFPKSILADMIPEPYTKDGSVEGFGTADEWEAWHKSMVGG